MTNAETSTATTEMQNGGVVLKDQAGDYFMLPQELLERAKVPADRRTELEELLAEQDVQGYTFVVGVAAGLAANALYDWLTSTPSMPAKQWFDTYGPGA